jgi:hypothetical protein
MNLTSKINPSKPTRQQQPSRAAVVRYWERVRGFEEGNRRAAKIILANVAKYGGETAGLVIWARMTLRHNGERRAA